MDIKNISTEQLQEIYNEAVYAYYQTEESILSDMEFDEIKEELEARGITLDEVESENIREKLESENNMLSLKKVQVFSEYMEQHHVDAVINWLKQYDPSVSEDTKVLVGWKLDGCALSIRMDNDGNPVDAVTRGNFSVSTKILKWVKKQQERFSSEKETCKELRCEVVMNKTLFEKIYSEQYSNPRNLVSGILNDINVDDSRAAALDFIVYNDGLNANNNLTKTFPQVRYVEVSIKELPFIFSCRKCERAAFPWQTDGLVVYLKDVKELKTIGKYPLHSLAIKFPPTKVETVVKDIQWNLKKSGEWIPKAILESVDLDGSRVSKSLVFNYGYVMDNQIAPGAVVEIAKNGDIIPYIQRVIKPGDMKSLTIPNGTVVGKHLLAEENSEKVATERFIAGCYTLSIKHFGYSWFKGCAKLCNNNIIELFNKDVINETSLKNLFGGEKKVKQFMSELIAIRDNGITIYQLLRMLQIPGLGSQTALQVAQKMSDLDYNYAGLEKSLIDSIEHGEYFKLIADNINNPYINVRNLEPKPQENYEATYEMTGSPKDFGFKTKADFQKQIPSWKPQKLDSKTTYLITDDISSTSAKMNKAIKLGVKIITYSQAIEIANQNK